MKYNILKRIALAAAISAVSLVGINVPTYAWQQQEQDQKKQEGEKQKKDQGSPTNRPSQDKRQGPPKQQPQDKRQQPQNTQQDSPKQQDRRQQSTKQQTQQQPQNAQQNQSKQSDRRQQATEQQNAIRSQTVQREQNRRPQPQQQQLIDQQKQRVVQYRDHLDQQQRVATQRQQQLRQQNRMAQFRFQQLYVARLHQQQLFIDNPNNFNYNNSPYFYTADSFRYSRGGTYYETNQYGASLLRRAVKCGYSEGFSAGQADRQDRWSGGYQDSYAYQDANYGYSGYYVDQDTYNYYFREGFTRGYDDGYNNRHQYGSYTSGRYVIQTTVLTVVLNLESLR
ncbi:MAG TPA: hypothetical protein VFC63_05180 [Blastocatellia bacterium]|nr:hypothetical protein [Blastocatellia bacterium]